MSRPSTSKSRGTCRYYKQPRGCFAGNTCKFMHAEPDEKGIQLTPYDKAKTCRFYAEGFCKRGEECWFQHTLPQQRNTPKAEADEEDGLCSICFDKPATYGLLEGCTHVFCISCIRQWRDASKKHNEDGLVRVTKLCPMCRAPSKHITPSSIFFRHGDAGKDQAIKNHKESMAKTPCRYFQKSKGKAKPFCPFGKDCFYQHINDDGTPHIFKDGVDVCMRLHPNRDAGPSFNPFNYRDPLEMIEVLLSNEFGDLTAALENLPDELDIARRRNAAGAFPSMLLRHPLPVPRPAPQQQERRQVDPDMPALEPINQARSRRSSVSSDASMPVLQDVSESDESGSDWSASEDDEEDGDGDEVGEDVIDALRALGVTRGRQAESSVPLSAAEEPRVEGVGGDAPAPFVTDGRGRVIGASGGRAENDAEVARTMLGRVFDSVFRGL